MIKFIFILWSVILLSGCGGSSGVDSSSPTPPSPAITPSQPTNQPPADTTPPQITLNGLASVTVEIGTEYVDAGASASDEVDGILQPMVQSNVNTQVLGQYEVIFSVSDAAGNAADTVSRIVNVVDITPPIISINGLDSITIEVGTQYVDDGATAMDNVDGIVTPNSASTVNTSVPGTYTVTYSISDSSGNAAQQQVRSVQVVDNVAPAITLNGPSTVTIEVGSDYSDAGATSLDNVDGIVTPNSASTVNTNIPGTYTITFSMTDSSGNVAQPVTRTVIVVSPNTVIEPGDLTWGKHEYLRSQIEQAQASVVGMGEFFVGAAGVMLSDQHVLAKVAVITRGLEVDKNRKVVNIWGEVSAMKKVYWANPGDKESLCIIELETPFQNYHVPVIAQHDASEGDLVFQVSHSAHVSNGNKGWAVSFGQAMADDNQTDGYGATTIPPLTAYANMDGNFGAGVFNEQGELIGLATGAQYRDLDSPWYIPGQPLHNMIMNSLETRSYTLTYDLAAIKSMLAQISLVPKPGGNTVLPPNERDAYEQVLPDQEITLIELLSEQSKDSVITISEGGCSGTLIHSEMVITNAHCVVHNRQLDIGFKGGERIRGDALAFNELIDLAVVKLRLPAPSYYPPATLAPKAFADGDIGYAVGSPGALWAQQGGWQVSPMQARGYRRGDYIMSGYILPGNSGSGVFNVNGALSSVLWGSGYGHDYLMVEGPLDRQDPHIYDLSPSSHKSATVTMADYPTLVEFATRFGAANEGNHDYVYDAQVSLSGDIYTVGRRYQEGSNKVLIQRLSSAAQWDPIYQFPLELTDASAVDIEADANGAMYVLIQRVFGVQQIVRLTPDGMLDTDFAEEGVLTLDIGREHLVADMAIDHLGRLLVTGTVISNENGANIYLGRWNVSGQIDTQFNGSGWTELDVAGYGDYAQKILIQGNDILVGGHTTLRSEVFRESDILVARFTQAGQLDTAYGQNGMLITQWRDYDHEQLSDMALQSDGKLVITGQNRGFGRITTMRYLSDGKPDSTFGDNGIVMLEDRYEIDVGVAVTIMDDGDILLAGNRFVRTSDPEEPGSGHYEMTMYRLDFAGNIQSDFAENGQVNIHSGEDDYVQSVLRHPNGNILVFGQYHDVSGASPTVTMLSADGQIQVPLTIP
ncbi:MAG: DUF5011 domain-containing protein [Alteromonadaceae bacterium]|nr:DUF5011 domain-containing protein [Alteromonadaceae bacterium]